MSTPSLSFPSSAPVRKNRRGLSYFETLGCLVGVAGGLWIGAQYFNVDLNGAAYQALNETEMLDQIPAEWRPANPDCPDGDCPDPAEARAAEQSRLNAKLEELRFEVARLSGGVDETPASVDESTSLTPADVAVRDRTHVYWQKLSRIVFEVTAIQNLVEPYAGTEQQPRALAVRRRSMEYGHEATSLLDVEGVDPEAIATGVRVSEWFTHSAEQLQTALELKTRQPVGGRSVSGAELWAQTEAEVSKRTELVRRKSQETSAYLTSKYFAEFPPLGL
ncbi:hypothetical protein Pla108_30780 [Botrimarina colliarenosi]|uniref:Uncharacterized protein n=1 Tax=Botrimarina colliarenosi TaxID=2528001 RepID=A0A5C6A8X9_9BACT|nr:hypothetical protein [Botrimarina colliarenosi]TWT95999.1 hypothetical protein Pla108_30780 [Botrimarina colliarenosi]